jgi:hypothetical protein
MQEKTKNIKESISGYEEKFDFSLYILENECESYSNLLRYYHHHMRSLLQTTYPLLHVGPSPPSSGNPPRIIPVYPSSGNPPMPHSTRYAFVDPVGEDAAGELPAVLPRQD